MILGLSLQTFTNVHVIIEQAQQIKKLRDVGFRTGAAALVRKQCVTLLSDVAREDAVEKGRRVLAGEMQPTHVRDVEDRAGVSRLLVLVDDRAIEDRHFPAGEVDKFCAGLRVEIMEGLALEHRGANVAESGAFVIRD